MSFNIWHLARSVLSLGAVKILPNGFTLGWRGGGNKRPKLRGLTGGWSAGVTKRFKDWLYSIDYEQLNGLGYAFSLTLKDCPATPADWDKCIRHFNRLCEGLHPLGVIRWQSLTEWQKRKVPHLHGCIYFPVVEGENDLAKGIVQSWLKASSAYRSKIDSQHVNPIDGIGGWFKYQSKHSARGVKHYQRAGKPKAWQTTGRMWRRGGSWPQRAALETLDDVFHDYELRRLLCKVILGHVRQGKIDKPNVLDILNGQITANKYKWQLGKHKTYLKSLVWARRLSRVKKIELGKHGSALTGILPKGLSVWLDKAIVLRVLCAVRGDDYPLVDAWTGEIASAREWLTRSAPGKYYPPLEQQKSISATGKT